MLFHWLFCSVQCHRVVSPSPQLCVTTSSPCRLSSQFHPSVTNSSIEEKMKITSHIDVQFWKNFSKELWKTSRRRRLKEKQTLRGKEKRWKGNCRRKIFYYIFSILFYSFSFNIISKCMQKFLFPFFDSSSLHIFQFCWFFFWFFIPKMYECTSEGSWAGVGSEVDAGDETIGRMISYSPSHIWEMNEKAEIEGKTFPYVI